MAETAVQTPSMVQLGADTRIVEYAMITAVVSGGGRVPQIRDFQQFVNRNLVPLTEALKVYRPTLYANGVRFTKLLEDSAWGPQTALALGVTLALTMNAAFSMPPTRSKGVAAWYAQNRAGLDALLDDPTVAAGPLPVAQAQAAASPTMSPATQPENLPDAISEAVNGSGSTVLTSPAEDRAAAVEQTFEVGETSPVLGTSRKGGVPLVAIAVAAGVLGGALWFMGRKKR